MGRSEYIRKYVGTGRTENVNVPGGRSFTVLEFTLFEDDLKLLTALSKTFNNGSVRFRIMKRKQISENGATHYGQVSFREDTLDPQNDRQETAHSNSNSTAHSKAKANGYQKQAEDDTADNDPDDDIPF